MIGMGMGVDHPVQPPDAGIEKLLAQIGRGVDQDGGLPALVKALHQHGTAAAGVARLVRVAIAPMAAETGNTAGGAAAENCETQLRHAQAALVQAAARVKSRSKLAVVAAANSASGGRRSQRRPGRCGRYRRVRCACRDRAAAQGRGCRFPQGYGRAVRRRKWRAAHGFWGRRQCPTSRGRSRGQARAFASVCAGRKAMHHAGVGASAVFLGQDAGHVVIRVAGMDDERQACLARGGDVDAQALLLHLCAVGGVVIVQPAFADADEFRMLARATNSSTVAIGSSAALIGWVPAAQKTGHGPRQSPAPAGPDAASCRSSPCGGHRRQRPCPRHRRARRRNPGNRGDSGCPRSRMVCLAWVSASGVRGAGSGGGNGQPLGGPVEIEKHIEDERGRVKVDRLAAPGARGQVGGQFGPCSGSGRVGGEAGQDRLLARHDGRGRLARGPGAGQPREQPVEQRKRQVEPRLCPARARGIGEFERRMCGPCPAGSDIR
jgi:hypothetical protein